MIGHWLPAFVPDPQDNILAVHAALLRTSAAPTKGSIVFFSGSDYRKEEHDSHHVDRTRIFDCATQTVGHLASPVSTGGQRPLEPPDLFCCGHALLGDGRLLVVGGTHVWSLPDPTTGGAFHHGHWPGLDTAFIFDPISLSWIEADRMPAPAGIGTYTGGRWYPTAIALGDGSMIAMSGHPDEHDIRHNNNTPVVFTASKPSGDQWRIFPFPSSTFELGEQVEGDRADREYPRAHLIPGGVVFCSTQLAPDDSVMATQMQILDPGAATRAFVGLGPSASRMPQTPFLPGAEDIYASYFGTSVLLPLLPERGYRAQVLLFGGERAWIVDLERVSAAVQAGTIAWNQESVGTLTQAVQVSGRSLVGTRGTPPVRRHVNAVILPSGEVFFVGGIEPPIDPPGDGNLDLDRCAVRDAEIYGPTEPGGVGSDRWGWSVVAAAASDTEIVPRNYHSVALLMPDGRVWCAGSSKDHGPEHEPRMQIYEPWYVHQQRPVIRSAPKVIHYGRGFMLDIRHNRPVQRIALLRCGTSTHGFDSDQRYVGINFNAGEEARLHATAPPTGDVAPPGMYLMFAVDDRGVPSEGRFVHLWDAWYRVGIPQDRRADPESGITAVWNDRRDHLDLFFIGDDGSVVSAFWEANKGWLPWFDISPPATAAYGQAVTALRRDSGHLDAFVIRRDGRVLSTFWEAGRGWVPWFAISPAATAALGQSVTALWRDPSHLDLFVIRGDGMVLSSFWDSSGGWVPWFGISPPNTGSALGQSVTALWKSADHLDAFITRVDGTVLSSFWEPSRGWVPWFTISPANTAEPHQSVTALWNTPDHLDVFVIRRDGVVMSSFWEASRSWVPWFAVSPADTAAPGRPVVALWSNPMHLDLFVTNRDGAVTSSFWEPSKSWAPWFKIDPPPQTNIAGKTIVAQWANRDHLDLFGIGSDGSVWGIWWEAFVSGW